MNNYYIIKNMKYNMKYIVIILILVLLFLFMYKKIIMYLLFNDFFTKQDIYEFINNTYKKNNFYHKKYSSFFSNYGYCNKNNFLEIPYLSKEELIEFNDEIITPPYKKCNLKCVNGCIKDPLWYDNNCSLGQSTGGTSGKSTFVWMNKLDIYRYAYTFINSFKKNGRN